jgi:hypothetical protein
MNRLEGISTKTLATLLVAFIVVGGFAVGLFTSGGSAAPALGRLSPYNGSVPNAVFNSAASAASGASFGGLSATMQTITASTTTSVGPMPPSTIVVGATPQVAGTRSAQTSFNQPGNGSLIEFFSDITIESAAPSELASKVIGLAYSVGGYVAYQSTQSSSANVVIRVPASTYQLVLGLIQGMGNLTSVTSTSNDVTVKYTDLNATLASLVTERQALLRLVNQSTSVNNTLAIENQLQYVNSQINSVQSEILQTQRLISYSTITVSVTKAAEKKQLSMTLSATPKSGVSPVGVTLNAVVSGGSTPYVVNYNFGDGTSQQGNVVIHQFYGSNDYNVTVTATDSNGKVATASTIVHVTEPPTKLGFGNFGITLANLLINVVEGMAVVAVVVLPAVLVAAAVVYPLRRRNRVQKEIKQG